MGTIPMPAWLRVAQQSFWWQAVLLPILTGFGGSLLLQGCLGHIESIDKVCVMAATNATILTFATAWIKGHSVGSTQFASDGSTIAAAPVLKELADNSVLLGQKAADPASPVTPAVAQKAEAALADATVQVAVQNQAVKAVVRNEVKP